LERKGWDEQHACEGGSLGEMKRKHSYVVITTLLLNYYKLKDYGIYEVTFASNSKVYKTSK